MLHRADTSDIPAIRTLAHAIWWAHYPGIIPPEQIGYMLDLMYSEEAISRQITEEGIAFWLVRTNGEPLGFVAVSKQAPGSYFINKFYLQSTEHGKGLGTSVFHALLEQYPDLIELRLTVNRQNYKSINFYFKVGFRIEQCLDMPIGQGYVMNDFVMVWQK
ncbi:MAG: GNAT family N-acetyltransferase [Saprospiraceae bacterium]